MKSWVAPRHRPATAAHHWVSERRRAICMQSSDCWRESVLLMQSRRWLSVRAVRLMWPVQMVWAVQAVQAEEGQCG